MDTRKIVIAILIAIGLIGGSLYYNDYVTKQEQNAVQYEEYSAAAYQLYNMGQQDQALEMFKQARDVTSEGSFEYLLMSGEVTFLEKKFDESYKYFEDAHKKNPDDLQINETLAALYTGFYEGTEEYTDFEKALPYNLKAAELDESEFYDFNIAINYIKLERYDDGLEILESLSPDAPVIVQYWLGYAYYKKGDLEQAKSFIKKFTDAGGPIDDPEILQLITE